MKKFLGRRIGHFKYVYNALGHASLNLLAGPQMFRNIPYSDGMRLTLNTSQQDLPLPGCTRPVLCDTTNAEPRPVIPATLRKAAFDSLHGLAHPGVRASTALILQQFVWPGARKDIRRWVRTCIPYQLSKCHRHTVSPLATFLPPSARFSTVHLDIVGPLPSSQGHRYLLTCVGSRAGRAGSLSHEGLDCRDRCALVPVRLDFAVRRPEEVVTDRGPQFESHLFAAFLCLLGTERIRSSAYHPACNGLVERFHRHLKQAIMAHGDRASWSDHLPSILLGIRAAVKVDLGCRSGIWNPAPPARRRLCTFIRPLHGSACLPRPPQTSFFATLQFTPTRAVASSPPFVPSELGTTSHVFLRTDRLRRALEPPYSGPYKVLRRSPKTFVIDVHGQHQFVSIDRLKPAFIDHAPPVSSLSGQAFPAPHSLVQVKHVTWSDYVPHAPSHPKT
ncbi:uncharacterized protein LOC135381622 [Ornithodoros turicata]|uniref:uncharacterized protein LOC135381622 n=1 Tax=Ornithodoros turicata TaxID=34597 RepID=UPI003139D307